MRRLPLTLTMAATVPFVGFSLAASMRAFGDTNFVVHALLSYSAVILSFLGGIHWGVAVTSYQDNKRIANLLIAESVISSIIGWAVVLHAPLHIQLLALTVLFTFIWAIDSVLVSRKILPVWFFEIRCIITPIVVVSLYVAYFGLT